VIRQHLPILQVVIPLLSAPLSVLLQKRWLVWGLTVVASTCAFVISILLLQQVLASGVISYMLGDWAAPWGIEYRIDVVNAFVLVIISGIGAIVPFYAAHSVEREITEDRISLFYTAYLLCLAGLLGIAATGDAFNVFVFLEISSLSSYILISLGHDRRALTASYQYLIMGTIGATFILIGIGLAYMMTGTLNMMDLARRIPHVADTRTIRAALAFLTVGISLKLALFPLHLWLPNAYAYAPSTVTAFLAATATKVAVYLLLRFLFTIFGEVLSFEEMILHFVLLPLALVAVFSASIVAIFQDNLKRMLAYSSVAQIGYIILGISFVSVTGLTAGILHLFNHALMKGALFLALGCVAYRLGSVQLSDIAGLGRRMPWTFAAIIIGGLSLIGVPLTVGFISKWYLVLAALEDQLWWVAVLVLVGSLLAVAYVWRVVEAAFFQPPPRRAAQYQEAPLSLLIPTWILIAANIYFGIDAERTAAIAQRAAEWLLRGPL
jgi:multicomponent Na+:H+ antiporter subunit D